MSSSIVPTMTEYLVVTTYPNPVNSQDFSEIIRVSSDLDPLSIASFIKKRYAGVVHLICLPSEIRDLSPHLTPTKNSSNCHKELHHKTQ